jgi:hypothetical protein
LLKGCKPSGGDDVLVLLTIQQWGDPKVCEIMQLSYISSRSRPRRRRGDELKVAFPITTNLALLLRHLRHPIVARILWIDAICINQTDNDERSWQVQLMASIYKQGVQSTIWLGEERDGSDQAFKVIKSHVQHLQTWGSFKDQISPTVSDEWNYISELFEKREIWMRIWVLQEVVFAPRPTLLCGRQVMDWLTFASFMTAISRHSGSTNRSNLPVHWRHCLLMNEQRSTARLGPFTQPGTHAAPLSELLATCRTFKSSDERDMIFALLNLTFNTSGITPNYNLTPSEVWIATIKAIIRDEGQFAFFETPFADSGDKKRWSGMPSWIGQSIKVEDLFDLQVPGRLDRNPKHWQHRVPAALEIGETFEELSVEGVFLDTLPMDDSQYTKIHEFLHTLANEWESISLLLEPEHQLEEDWSNMTHLLIGLLLLDLPRGRKIISESFNALTSETSGTGDSSYDACEVSSGRQLISRELSDCAMDKGSACLRVINEASNIVIRRLRSIQDDENDSETLKQIQHLRICITQRAFAALLPPSAKPGDSLYTILGSKKTLVLRPISSGYRYRVIGNAEVYSSYHCHLSSPHFFPLRGRAIIDATENYYCFSRLIHQLNSDESCHMSAESLPSQRVDPTRIILV